MNASVEQLYRTIKADPALVAEFKEQASPEAAIQWASSVAAKHGIPVGVAELTAVANGNAQELSELELDMVAGGKAGFMGSKKRNGADQLPQ